MRNSEDEYTINQVNDKTQMAMKSRNAKPKVGYINDMIEADAIDLVERKALLQRTQQVVKLQVCDFHYCI